MGGAEKIPENDLEDLISGFCSAIISRVLGQLFAYLTGLFREK